jgi:hypothetical protein
LRADDELALEATGSSDAIATLLGPRVGRVVVSNRRRPGRSPRRRRIFPAELDPTEVGSRQPDLLIRIIDYLAFH